MSTTIVAAPSAAMASAMARPMPRAPPVTRAIFPSSLAMPVSTRSSVLLPVSACCYDFKRIRRRIMANETYERGLALRKEVLGDDYVARSFANADDFSRPMQELSTEYCWGRIWSRDGLSRRDRSLLNIGMISALNRPNELKLHVKAALNNGLTREEIREALLQVAIYCGVPAGLDSTRIAREAFAELDQAQS